MARQTMNQEFVRAQSADVQRMIRGLQRMLGNDQIHDLAEHGADAGFPRLSYYADVVRFYRRHEAAIWQILADMADDRGTDPVTVFYETAGIKQAWHAEAFYTHITYLTLEYIARGMTQPTDEE